MSKNADPRDELYELYALNHLHRRPDLSLSKLENADENALCEALPFLFKPNRLLALHAGDDKKGGRPTDDPYNRWLIKLDLPKALPVIAVVNRQWQLSLWHYKNDANSGGLFPLSVTSENLKNNSNAPPDTNIILLPKKDTNAEYQRDTFELIRFEKACSSKHIYLSLFTQYSEHFLRLDSSNFESDSPQISYFLTRIDFPTEQTDQEKILSRQIGGWDDSTSFFFSWGEEQPLCQEAPKGMSGSKRLDLSDELADAKRRLWAAAERDDALALGGNFDAILFRVRPSAEFVQFPMPGLVRCAAVVAAPAQEEFGTPINQKDIGPLILAGCDDYRLYVLNKEGKELGNIFLDGMIESILILHDDANCVDLAIIVRAKGVYCARLFYDQLKFQTTVVENGHPVLHKRFIERLIKVLNTQSQWLETQLKHSELEQQILGLLALLHQPSVENLNIFKSFLPRLNSNAAEWLIYLLYRWWCEVQKKPLSALEKMPLERRIFKLFQCMVDEPMQCRLQAALYRYAGWLQTIDSKLAPSSELARFTELARTLERNHLPKQEFTATAALNNLANFRHLILSLVYSDAWRNQRPHPEKIPQSGRISSILMLPSKENEHAQHTVVVSVRSKQKQQKLKTFCCIPFGGKLPESLDWSPDIDAARICATIPDPLIHQILIVTNDRIGWATYNQAIIWHTELPPFKSVWTAAFSHDGDYLVVGGEWHFSLESPAPLYVLQRKIIEKHTTEKGAKHRQHLDEWKPLPTRGLLPPQNRQRVRITTLAWAKAEGEQRDLWATAGGRGEIIYWTDAQAVLGAQTERPAQIAGIVGTAQTALVILHLARKGEYLAICGGEDGVVRAFDKHGRLCWLNVLPGSICGITVRSQKPLDPHDPYAPLAVLCDEEHLFLFDENGLQRGILHLPHWTLSCLARANIAGKAYHLIGDLTGKVLLVKELPKEQSALALCSGNAQASFKQCYNEYAKSDFLSDCCASAYASSHPLQAAWAAQELIIRGEFEPILALLEAIKGDFDTASRTLRPLIFHALGKSFSKPPSGIFPNLTHLIGSVRDGVLASFLHATPHESNANKRLANHVFIIARNKALKEQRPFTTQALLEMVRIRPDIYVRRVESILIEIIKKPNVHQNTNFLEGLFVAFFSSLQLSEVGILAALANIPEKYPNLNKRLVTPDFRARFITLLDTVSWSVFSSQEAAAWRFKKYLLHDGGKFEADEFEAKLLHAQSMLQRNAVSDASLIKQFLSFLPNITMLMPSNTTNLPLLWRSYADWTNEIRQLFRDSHLLDPKAAKKKLQDVIKVLEEPKLAENEPVLLNNFTLLWKNSWLKACREKLNELPSQSKANSAKPDQVLSFPGIIAHINSMLKEKGFNTGVFYRLLEVPAQNSILRVLKRYPPDLSNALQTVTVINENEEDRQVYFSQYLFTGGHPERLYWEIHEDPKIDNGSFWYKHQLVQGAHLELPYLEPFHDGYRAGGFLILEDTKKPIEKVKEQGMLAKMTKLFSFLRSEQDIERLTAENEQALLEQFHLLKLCFQQQETEYENYLNEFEQLLTNQYKVDEQLVKQAQQAIVEIAIKLSYADGAVLWQPEPKDERFLEAVAAASPIEEYSKLYKERKLWRKEQDFVSVKCWKEGVAQFAPNWSDSPDKQHSLSKENSHTAHYRLLAKLNSLVSLPVKFADKVLAVLTLHSYQTYAFDELCLKRVNKLLERSHWFLHTLYLQQERNQERHAWEGAMLHEIRSELNPLKHRLDQAMRMPKPEKYLRIAQRQVEELYHLADNFMEISGHSHADFSAVIDAPGAAVEKFLCDYQDTIEKTEQTYVLNPDDHRDTIWHTQLQGKPEVFSRVVRNLLHNAFKYGGAGAEIHIDADMQAYKDGYYWHLKISNPGHMTREEDDLKFVPRAHPTDRPEGHRDGAHVGLAASKQCALAYQAHLTLYNDKQTGRVVAELGWPLAQQPANSEEQ